MSYASSTRSRAPNTNSRLDDESSRRNGIPCICSGTSWPTRRSIVGAKSTKTHQSIRGRTGWNRRQMLPFRGEIDNQRHMQAGVVEHPLAARQARPVISVEKHDSVVRRAILLQFGQQAPHMGVHGGNGVIVAGHGLAHIRIVGGNTEATARRRGRACPTHRPVRETPCPKKKYGSDGYACG